MRKLLRAQVLKFNGQEIIERGHTFVWSLDAFKTEIEQKIGENESHNITDIDLQNLECSSIALKELLNLSMERIK